LGIGDWGLGIGPNPQSPIPNPQLLTLLINKYYIYKTIIKYTIITPKLLNEIILKI